MVKESIVVKQEKYVLDGTKTYCLYNNKEQENLLAISYDEAQIKEATKYYSEGVWFEYDNVKDINIILNERKYKKKVTFPEEPEMRPTYFEAQEQFQFASNVGDLR